MEREKQKNAEKEREQKERSALLEQRKLIDQNDLKTDPMVPIKSKFVCFMAY